MIDYDSLPSHFNDQCLSAIEVVQQGISDGGEDWWFSIEFNDYNGPELELYFDWNHQRGNQIKNSSVLRSYIAAYLLEKCPIDRLSAYGSDFIEPGEVDLWFGYRLTQGSLIELELCESPPTGWIVFCEDL